MEFRGSPLPECPDALTRIQSSALRLIDLIRELPPDEMNELAEQFEVFEANQTAFITKRAELRSLPEGAPFSNPLTRWQPPPKKQHGKANQRRKTGAEVAERAADIALRELQKEREEAKRQEEIHDRRKPKLGLYLQRPAATT